LRKIRKLSLFGILGVVIAVLFLISISFTQAQVNIQAKPDKPPGKPDKPGKPPKDPPAPEATWAVRIPTEDNTMLYGDGATYTNNDTGVIIKVEKGKSMVRVDGKRQIVFYYYFCFKLLNPTSRYAGFQGVVLNEVTYPAVGPYCIFPGINGLTCMQSFLYQNHPHSDYEYFYLKFQVGQHSFTDVFGDSIDGIEDMPENIPVKFISYSDWIKIRVQNQEDFLDPSSEYHNVECDERNYDDDDLENMYIWITRMAEDRWRISVEGANLLLQEQYTQRAVGKGKKGGTKTVTVVPYEATGNFTFYIDFIKIPATE